MKHLSTHVVEELVERRVMQWRHIKEDESRHDPYLFDVIAVLGEKCLVFFAGIREVALRKEMVVGILARGGVREHAFLDKRIRHDHASVELGEVVIEVPYFDKA